ncbi:hypothetical protein F4801DRAFT_597912 [Xylaria longipes]|nr:hypothetical protein F4801DRAFT_597912 [Xylaria longipes]
MEVETLIPQMQDTLSEIRITVNGLSTKSQDDELDQLEQKREHLLADLQTSFERVRQELDTKRRMKSEEIKKKRKQEDEERAARRRQEDQELEKANADEDVQRRKKYDSEARSVEDETEQKMDEIEEAAQKMIQEGKQKLRALEEKRRVSISDIERFAHRLKVILQELNHRIDEQLKQSLPTSPSRNRDRPKKGPGDTQKNGIAGDSTSTVPRNTDSSPKTSNKPDTLSKSQPPSATNSPVKSAETKKDGELPFQHKSNGPPQAAKVSAMNLPRSFAEALKNDVSNGSKGKSELGEPSLDGVVQAESNYGERGNEMKIIGECESLGSKIIATIPTIMEDVTARGSGAMTPGIKVVTREDKLVENTESFSDLNSQLENSRSRGHDKLSHKLPSTIQLIRCSHAPGELNNLDPIIPQQNQLNCRLEYAEEHGSTVSNVDTKRSASIQRASDQLHIPITHEVETKKPRKNSTAERECSEVSKTKQRNSYPPDYPSNEKADTVEVSKSTFQSSRLPTTSKTRNPREQDKETYNQVGFEQPGTSDILKQNHPGYDRDFPDTLSHLRASSQSKVPVETVLSAPRISTQGGLILLLGRNVSVLSSEPRSSVAFDEIQDTKKKHLPAVGKQAREVLASPLPVENETVHGQDQLFDDNKSASDPSEPHTGDEHSELSPYTPIEGQYLPVLLEPIFKNTLDDQGLTTLIGGSGRWGIFTEELDGDRSRHLPSKFPPTQEVGGFNQLDMTFRAESNGPQNDGCSKLRPKKVNISQQSTRQNSSPHLMLRERDHNRLHPNHPSRDTYSFNDQGPSYSQSALANVLYSQVLSGVVGSISGDQGSTAYDVKSIDPAKPKYSLRGDSVERHPKRPKQRGRPRKKAFELPERALNPRELVFRSCEDDINIRSAWFKGSKRGLG